MPISLNYMKDWNPKLAQYRSYLVAFAFRMTGSLSEAEDLVQDTFLECAKVDPATIQNPKAWLTKVCSNKCLDHMKSAYKKRENYTGTWLPDAIPDSLQVWESLVESPAPDRDLALAESLTMSFLLLVERLSPEERVVYLLSEVFEYSFQEIAEFLGKSDANCRKIAERARKSVASGQKKFAPNSIEPDKLISRFFESAKNGDKDALMTLLAPDSEFWSDGGGRVPAAQDVLTDAQVIAKFFAFLGTSQAFQSSSFKQEFGFVNGRPGLIVSKRTANDDWVLETLFSFEIQGDRISRIYAQRNPEKLDFLLKLH